MITHPLNPPPCIKRNGDACFLLLTASLSVLAAYIWAYYSCVFILAIILGIGLIAVFLKSPAGFLYCFAFSKISLDAVKLLHYDLPELGIRRSLSLDGVGTGALVICGLIYFFKKGRAVKVFALPGIKAYLVFLGICLASITFSQDKIIGARFIVHYLSYALIYILGVNILDSREKNRKMVGACFLSALIPLAAGLYQASALRGDNATPGFNRIYATTFHPNAYAFYLVILLVMSCVMFFYSGSIRKKTLLFLFSLPVLSSLILTYTRGAWVAAVSGLLLFALLLFRKNKFTVMACLCLAAALVAAAGIYLAPELKERIFSLSYNLSADKADSLGWRFLAWQIYFREFLKHPITGYGIGSVDLLGKLKGGYIFAPHNEYLRLMVGTGLLGLVAFLASILSLLKFFLRKYKVSACAKDGVLAAGMVALISSIFVIQAGDNLHHYDEVFAYFWFFAAAGYNLLERA